MRSGEALTQLVEFTTGQPDGDITWELLDGRGQLVTNDTVTPAADAASAVIQISGATNALASDTLFEPRELQWSYTVNGMLIRGRQRYRLEAFLPFGVSEDGVRRKLGLESHELVDEDIDLVVAYARFRDMVTADALDAASGYVALQACDAIEAYAALDQLPTLQVKVAQKESSGTDQYQRADIDWGAIRVQLDQFVAQGVVAVNPLVDLTLNYGSLLVIVNRDDPVTGATV